MPSQHYTYSSIQRGQCLPFSATVNKDDTAVGVNILIKFYKTLSIKKYSREVTIL